MKNQIVIAYKQGDLMWAKDFAEDFDIFVYNKGRRPIKYNWLVHTEKLPNIGKATHSYLYHVVNNYDKLAPVTIFLRDDAMGGKFTITPKNLIEKISTDEVVPLGQILACDEFGVPHHPGLPCRKYWEEMFDEPIWSTLAFVAGGHYAVPASSIQRRPLDWWKKQLNHPEAQVNPIPEPECEPKWIWCMERLMSVIWEGDVKGKL